MRIIYTAAAREGLAAIHRMIAEEHGLPETAARLRRVLRDRIELVATDELKASGAKDPLTSTWVLRAKNCKIRYTYDDQAIYVISVTYERYSRHTT